jgi:tetratricopeptide (TPR) repeat protein
MPEVFLSYRQTNDTERQRVRAFAERLRSSGIRVILDQFFLEDHPGGPNDGWDKWSSDRALQTSHVIIIGSESWFQCFDKTQPPGTGLGAACEADDIRHRVYEANGIVETIRVVLFDDADANHISAKLKRYHRFHAARDFDNIIRWLKDTQKADKTKEWGQRNQNLDTNSLVPMPLSTPRSNLPTIQRFFGRDTELAKLLPDLHPDATGWGALIDGPGGMGKTTLAIRAAELAAPGHYDDILFLSAKQTAMDPHGPHDESPFAVSGFTQMLDAIARRLQKPEITQAPADERPRLLIDALTGTRTLLVLDNLETLTDADQRSLFAFLGHLPRTCKALLTSRPLVIATGRRLKLQQLDQAAALQTLADIARDNPALAAAPEPDRLRLITETGGNTLLLTWTAWQVGSGYSTTIADALAHLRSCPQGNDPLEFIFGDLLARFTPEEERIVATLSYPTEPIPVTAIAEISGVDEPTTRRALKLLTNRSIVVPQEGEEKYALVPMAAEFVRHARREVVRQMGEQLADRAFTLVIENGCEKHDRFPILKADWPTVAPALPIFIAGDNSTLQTVCDALHDFFNYNGFWDECFALSRKAESAAIAAEDFFNAGWRAYEVACIYDFRKDAHAVLKEAARVQDHWKRADIAKREIAISHSLFGRGHRLTGNYPAAITAFSAARDVLRSEKNETKDLAVATNALATAELLAGESEAAELDLKEALRIAKKVGHAAIVASAAGNLTELAIYRGDWNSAETLGREALRLSKNLRYQEFIAADSRRLAKVLLRLGRHVEAKPHAALAVQIYSKLASPELSKALASLAECETNGSPHHVSETTFCG